MSGKVYGWLARLDCHWARTPTELVWQPRGQLGVSLQSPGVAVGGREVLREKVRMIYGVLARSRHYVRAYNGKPFLWPLELAWHIDVELLRKAATKYGVPYLESIR